MCRFLFFLYIPNGENTRERTWKDEEKNAEQRQLDDDDD
jgi:hypothetical protein